MKRFRSYRDAGVDIDAGNDFVQQIKPLVRTTFRPEVQADLGGFASLFSLNTQKYKQPMLVSGTDGVGTKLKIAFMAKRYDTVGIDLVAMCVNDIVCCGAEPLFFLDYFACGKLETGVAVEVVKGIINGCQQSNCALVGGETAEMPDFYPAGEFDLAGFATGVVERDKVVDGSAVSENDCVIGVASSGVHSNGFSLVRKLIFEQLGLGINDRPVGFRGSVADELLTPTKIYVRTVQNLLRDFPIHGIVHITGGGLIDNIPRILPDRTQVRLNAGSWETPYIFEFMQRNGELTDTEMHRTFNCGIGLVLICPKAEAENVLIRLSGLNEQAWVIGEIVSVDDPGAPPIEIVTP
jgi:phosphoribosylformylglycinamidine cyclo-ligase